MPVNPEPISGFILEIKSIPNYLQGHMVAAMCLTDLKFQFRLDLKKAIFYHFSSSQITKN